MKSLKLILGLALGTTSLGGAVSVAAVSLTQNNVQVAEAASESLNTYSIVFADEASKGFNTVHVWGVSYETGYDYEDLTYWFQNYKGSITTGSSDKNNTTVSYNSGAFDITQNTSVTRWYQKGGKQYVYLFPHYVKSLSFIFKYANSWDHQSPTYTLSTRQRILYGMWGEFNHYGPESGDSSKKESFDYYSVTRKYENTTLGTDKAYAYSYYKVPDAYAPAGYTFQGWYKDSSFTQAFSAKAVLTGNMTLYAKCQNNSVNVTKYAVVDGVNQGQVETDSIARGSTYAVPKGIYRAGCSFDGWYTDSACQSPYTARTLNADLNLYGKYTSGTWEGSIKIDLRTSGWADSGANYAVYLMDKSTYSTVVSGWSEYKENIAANHYYFEVSYEAEFEPTDLTIVRYNASYTKASWNSNKWPTGQFTQTIDYSISSNIEMFRISDVKEDGKNLAYKGYPKVIGGPSGTWADITYLNSVKSNGSNHAEYYSTNVVLNAGDLFKVQVPPFGNADYYGNYSTHKSIEGNFADGGSANIRTVVGGTYAFYFDSINNSTYITKVEIAQADEWAQAFTSGMQCDGDGSITKDSWGTLSESYSLLMPEAKAIFLAVAEGGKEDGSFVEQAICRYDYIVKKYGTTAKPDFMGRIAAGKIHLSNNAFLPITSNYSGAMAVVIITSSIIAISGVSFFLLKKKKQD